MSLVVELLSSKCPPACQTHTPHPQHHIKGHQTPRVKWRMVSGKFIEFSCPNKITHLELYNIYTTDQLNPPPTPDPYSPPTTPQPPCKFHNPNVKRFQVQTSLSHLSTLQLSVTRLAPNGPVTFAPSALVHSLRHLVQSISLTQMPPHWNSLASSGRHLSLIV